jgi:hypothetical protein
MGNNVSRFDDAETEPDYAMEVGGDAEVAWACLEERLPSILRLEDCARSAEEMAREREEMKRQSHNRTTNLWDTIWGRLLLNPNLNEPSSWEHRTFMRRFRLSYQLFKQASSTVYSAFLILHQTILSTHFIQLVVQAREFNLFNQKRQGKIPFEFKLLIGLRILGRDLACDELDELLNIGGSTINTIFKQFVQGMATKLYDRHVHVPQGAELDKVVEVVVDILLLLLRELIEYFRYSQVLLLHVLQLD